MWHLNAHFIQATKKGDARLVVKILRAGRSILNVTVSLTNVDDKTPTVRERGLSLPMPGSLCIILSRYPHRYHLFLHILYSLRKQTRRAPRRPCGWIPPLRSILAALFPHPQLVRRILLTMTFGHGDFIPMSSRGWLPMQCEMQRGKVEWNGWLGQHWTKKSGRRCYRTLRQALLPLLKCFLIQRSIGCSSIFGRIPSITSRRRSILETH